MRRVSAVRTCLKALGEPNSELMSRLCRGLYLPAAHSDRAVSKKTTTCQRCICQHVGVPITTTASTPEVVAVVRELLAPRALELELLVKYHEAALAVAVLVSQVAARQAYVVDASQLIGPARCCAHHGGECGQRFAEPSTSAESGYAALG